MTLPPQTRLLYFLKEKILVDEWNIFTAYSYNPPNVNDETINQFAQVPIDRKVNTTPTFDKLQKATMFAIL